jgi:predicted nucleic acid-binding protein
VNSLFVDTSAWMAILDAGDVNHPTAVAYQTEIVDSCSLLVTNYILDELYTLTLMDLGYRFAMSVKRKLDLMSESRLLEVVWVDRALADESWRVFERFNQDKQWSFTDCVSYTVMKQRAIQEAFAFDHHFEQMGFIRRPSPPPSRHQHSKL